MEWSGSNKLILSFDKFCKEHCYQKRKKSKPSDYICVQHDWELSPQNGHKERISEIEHLRRVIPRTTKETVKCTMVKTYILCAVFYASNVWKPGPQYLQRLERTVKTHV